MPPSPLPNPITVGLMNGRGKLLVYHGNHPTVPLRIGLGEFLFEAVPYGLSWVNRFAGQIGLYSDAQHSVLLSRIVGPNPRHQLAALIHDTGETLGAGDTNTFLKRLLGATALSEYEDTVCEAIWKWVGAPGNFRDLMVPVHALDKALGTEEARQAGLVVPPCAPELSIAARGKVDLSERWGPRYAEDQWWSAWNRAFAEATR